MNYKNILFFFLISACLVPSLSKAQPYAPTFYGKDTNIKKINAYLRSMFRDITFNGGNRKSFNFLYERSVKLTSPAVYDYGYTLPSYLIWKQVYQEIRHSALDTNIMRPLTIYNNVGVFFGDTFNFGLLLTEYEKFKPEVMISDSVNKTVTFNQDYFDTTIYNSKDTVLRIKKNKNPFAPGPLPAFFAGPTHKAISKSKVVTFFINEKFSFIRKYILGREVNELSDLLSLNTSGNIHVGCEIDFGDGRGFISLKPLVNDFYQVYYPDSGTKTITTRIYSTDTPFGVKRVEGPDNRKFLYQSKSQIYVVGKDPVVVVEPNEKLEGVTGMKVNVYKSPCDKEIASYNKQVVIYVPGFDLGFPEKRTLSTSYYDLKKWGLDPKTLGMYNYDLYILEWEDAKADLRFNAYNLLLLLEKLKKEYSTIRYEEDYPVMPKFVIIGHSMGGVIARFLLRYMESPYYPESIDPFFKSLEDPFNKLYLKKKGGLYSYKKLSYKYRLNNSILIEKRHNTRLLITLDAPHQGAVLPLSLQYAFRHFTSSDRGHRFSILGLSLYSGFGDLILNFTAKKLQPAIRTLNSMATRQMLMQYVRSKGPNKPLEILKYGDPMHTEFYEQYRNLNNKQPIQQAKTVALTSGALNGSNISYNDAYNNNAYNPVAPNSLMADIDITSQLWFLGLRCKMTNVGYTMWQDPKGSGDLLRYSYGRYFYGIQFYWLGLRIGKNPVEVFSNKFTVKNARPLSVVSGGVMNIKDLPGGKQIEEFKFGSSKFFNPGVVIKNSLNKQPFLFSFVPVESAIDYNAFSFPNQVSTEIFEDVQNKLSTPSTRSGKLMSLFKNTNFDLVVGNLNRHQGHSDIVNPLIKNYSYTPIIKTWLGNNFHDTAGRGLNLYEREYYDYAIKNPKNFRGSTKLGSKETLQRTLLSMEIGDEELYLSHFDNTPYAAIGEIYQARYNLYVNIDNPYYYYSRINQSLPEIELKYNHTIRNAPSGMPVALSRHWNDKKGQFRMNILHRYRPSKYILYNAQAGFVDDIPWGYGHGNGVMTNTGLVDNLFFFNNLNNLVFNRALQNPCNTLPPAMISATTNNNKIADYSFVNASFYNSSSVQPEDNLYPNPVSAGSVLHVSKIGFNQQQPINCKLFSLIGQPLVHMVLPADSYQINLAEYQLSSGTYLIELSQSNKRKTYKLTIL